MAEAGQPQAPDGAPADARASGLREQARSARHRLAHSLRARLVALFLLLAFAMTAVFLFGMQRALTAGWRDAARPLVADYVDRLVRELGTPPSVEQARRLAERLPIVIRISGPQVNWHSLPDNEDSDERWRRRDQWLYDSGEEGSGSGLLSRRTSDGHRVDLGLNLRPWRDRPRFIGWATLAVLLLLTAASYHYVRRMLRPLDDIRAGARRFGEGEFAQPIPVRRRDELGELAHDVNGMASSLHGMLDAKRALLLAISHELRSPITRARLHAELLDESGDTGQRRKALLADLREMADLVADLLESERLGLGHQALQREPTDLRALVDEVLGTLAARWPRAGEVRVEAAGSNSPVRVDPARTRLLLRNLLDNALRHTPAEAPAPLLRVEAEPERVYFTLRDWGPGVEEAALKRLSEPFYRPDAARERATGGVGLGLYLCRLVARAHGGALLLRNAQPGLEVRVTLGV